MEDETLISIVVPVYNVEEYLRFCLDSICGQTYKNIEIIIVDDGSTDNSSKICDEYAKLDKRIIVIHKNNGGLSDARNEGLKIAKGKYIAFIDSDDFLSPIMIQSLFNACEDNHASVSVCKFVRFYNVKNINDSLTELNKSESLVITGRQYIEKIYKGEGEQYSFTAWNKLYAKALFDLNNIEYPIHKYYEDTQTTYKLFYFSDKVVCLQDALYFYRIRKGSITAKFTVKHCIDGITADINTLKFFAANNELALLSLAFNSYFKSTMITYKLFLKKMKKSEKIECKKLLINNYRKTYKKYINIIKTSFVKKFIFKIFYIFPRTVFIMPVK